MVYFSSTVDLRNSRIYRNLPLIVVSNGKVFFDCRPSKFPHQDLYVGRTCMSVGGCSDIKATFSVWWSVLWLAVSYWARVVYIGKLETSSSTLLSLAQSSEWCKTHKFECKGWQVIERHAALTLGPAGQDSLVESRSHFIGFLKSYNFCSRFILGVSKF